MRYLDPKNDLTFKKVFGEAALLMMLLLAGRCQDTGKARKESRKTFRLISARIRTVDPFASSEALFATLLSDKVHPNVAGYAIFHANLKKPLAAAASRVISSAYRK